MNIQEQIDLIKTRMPETYKAIQAREKGVMEEIDGRQVVVIPAYGREVYALVRRGLLGQPNCFWAMERGHVMGTPFNIAGIQAEAAAAMVQYGCAHVCIFQEPNREAAHGTH